MCVCVRACVRVQQVWLPLEQLVSIVVFGDTVVVFLIIHVVSASVAFTDGEVFALEVV